MDEVALRLASSGAELASALTEPTALADQFTSDDLGALHGVVKAAADVDTFLAKPLASRDQCRVALQSLYRLAGDGLRASGDSKPNGVAKLPPAKLVTVNFHAEQIWGQIDVLAEAAMKRVRKAVKHGREDLSVLEPSMEEAVDQLITGVAGDLHEAGSSGDDSGSEQEGDSGDEMDGIDEERASEGSDEDLGAQPSGLMDLDTVDYDELLEAGHRTHKKSRRESRARKHEPVASDNEVEEDKASEGSEEEAGLEAGEKLLPTEDDFLRLDDMEAFVQQAEAAHAAGDTGGFDTFQELLEGNELGGGAAAERKERMRVGDADSDDVDSEEEVDDGVEAGLRAALEEGGSEDEVDLYAALDSEGEEPSGPHAAGGIGDIKYEDFFGRSTPYSGQKRSKTIASEHDDPELEGEGVSDDGDGSNGSEEDHEDSEGGSDDDEMHGADGGPTDPSRDLSSGKNDVDSDQGPEGEEKVLSTHEKRQLRVAREIEKVEGELMADKSWQFRGEASAKQRPKDSALEVDLDFDRTMRPPPQPTLEAASKLEDVIKERILELRFDNVIRVNVEGPEHVKGTSRQQVELRDSKSKEGLADEYAKDYHAAVSGVTEDRHAKTRAEMKGLFAELSAKLDALSHLSLTPKPIVTDLEVHADVPAIAMEEAAPVATSMAAMQAPEEAHAKVKQKGLKADAEKTQADRHAARATKKRVSKRKKTEQEESEGVWAHDKGIKSAREDAQAAREAAALNKRGKRGKFSHGKSPGGAAGKKGVTQGKEKSGAIATNSTAVFKSLEAAKAAGSEGGAGEGASGGPGEGVRSAKFMY